MVEYLVSFTKIQWELNVSLLRKQTHHAYLIMPKKLKYGVQNSSNILKQQQVLYTERVRNE